MPFIITNHRFLVNNKKENRQEGDGLTFDWLCPKCQSNFADSISNSPVLLADFDQSLSNLSSSPGSLDSIRFGASDRRFVAGSDNDGFSRDGCISINLSTDMDFYDIVFGECEVDERVRW